MELIMKRASSVIVVSLGLVLVASPAFAQQPIEPDSGYGAQPMPTQPDPYAQPQPYAQQPYAQQPYAQQPYAQQPYAQQPYAQQPYNQYGDDDEEDDYDVTYDYDASASTDPYDDGYDPYAYQQFESTLAPYGNWQNVPSYGHVWIPSVSAVGYNFSPYATGGHWVMTDYGWTWVSDWDWGWAPFHYGRWMVVGGHGWCWIPGTTWGPAWVNWRWGGGYVGWAPMPPRGVVIGPPRGVRCPWHFTTAAQLGTMRPNYLPSRVVNGVWRSTNPVNNIASRTIAGAAVRFNAGPPAHVVASTLGRPVAPVALAAVAPRLMPRTTIVPRTGMPVQSRPWMQSRPIGGAFSHPVPGARTIGAPRPAAPIFQRPQPLSSMPPGGRYVPPPAVQGRAQGMPWRTPAPLPPQRQGQLYVAPPQSQRFATPAPQPYHPPAQSFQPQPYRYAPPPMQQHFSPPPVAHGPVYSAPPMQQHFSPPPVAHGPVYSAPPMQQHFSPPPQQHFSPPPQQQHFSPPPAQHFSAPAPHGSFGGSHGTFRR
jgi:hypothetical protein